jgi:hypothetical protein
MDSTNFTAGKRVRRAALCIVVCCLGFGLSASKASAGTQGVDYEVINKTCGGAFSTTGQSGYQTRLSHGSTADFWRIDINSSFAMLPNFPPSYTIHGIFNEYCLTGLGGYSLKRTIDQPLYWQSFTYYA